MPAKGWRQPVGAGVAVGAGEADGEDVTIGAGVVAAAETASTQSAKTSS
jgi:hypothetical protein